MDKIARTFSVDTINDIVKNHLNYFTFDVITWLSNKENVALIKGNNATFGEYKSPGVYWVHFCYNDVKGREAIELTKAFLQEFYSIAPVKTSVGLIVVENKKARWLIRQVGFSSAGLIETANGLCEMFLHFNEKESK